MKKKLSAKIRYEIGRRANAGEKIADLAKEFMIDKSTVYMYKAMKCADNSELLEDNKKHRSKTYFNKTRIDAAMKDFNDGMSVFEVSAKHNCSRTDIWNWKRHRYPDAYYLEIAEQHGYGKDNSSFCNWLEKINMFAGFVDSIEQLCNKNGIFTELSDSTEHLAAILDSVMKFLPENNDNIFSNLKLIHVNKVVVAQIKKYVTPKLMTDTELKAALKLPTTREELEEAYRSMQ